MAVTNFVWDVENDSYLMETDGSGQTQATYTSEPVEYGSLVSQERAGTTHYYHSDVVGSTRQLTDANEATTDSYDYTAFGESVAQSGSTTNPFRFWGQFGGYSDAELANEVYIRRRRYLRSEGRWGSVDPIGFVDSTNLYQFVGNNPVLLVDPSGFQSVVLSCQTQTYYRCKCNPVSYHNCKFSAHRILCHFDSFNRCTCACYYECWQKPVITCPSEETVERLLGRFEIKRRGRCFRSIA